MPVVGYLFGMPEQMQVAQRHSAKAWAKLGFIEGHNVTIEFRFAGNDLVRLPELVADLVHHRVAVIAATAARRRHSRPRRRLRAFPSSSRPVGTQSNVGSSRASTGRAAMSLASLP